MINFIMSFIKGRVLGNARVFGKGRVLGYARVLGKTVGEWKGVR